MIKGYISSISFRDRTWKKNDVNDELLAKYSDYFCLEDNNFGSVQNKVTCTASTASGGLTQAGTNIRKRGKLEEQE